jgi:hypothetical protein
VSTAPDLAALDPVAPWRHFGAVRADGLVALRAAMGASYADQPEDAVLEAALAEAAAYLEGATGRIFVPRVGTLTLDGSGSHRLPLPLPVASAHQVAGGGVTEILLGDDSTPLKAGAYQVSDGAGLPGRDPRDAPFIDLVGPIGGFGLVSRPLGYGRWSVWPDGTRNVQVTATWGFLDESGATPLLARKALAGLTVRALAPWDDRDALDDLHLGAIVTETTRDRSIGYGERAAGGGVTLDRELDLLISRLRAPARVRTPRAVGRRTRDARDALLYPPRYR